MKKNSILIIYIISAIAIISIILSLINLETYSVNLDIEGVNSYPPRLTQLVNRGISQESVLSSLIPSLNVGKLSIGSPITEMNGEITLICGAGYEQTKNWSVSADVYGVELLDQITFKGVPSDTTCIAEAVTDYCSTSVENGNCQKLTKTISLKIPKNNN
jgi:hypothetical protein